MWPPRRPSVAPGSPRRWPSPAVNLYDQALCELGIVEYTGIAVRDNLDLPSQENEVEQTELGNIAANDTGAGLQTAQTELARSIKRLYDDRQAAAAAKAVAAHRRALLVAAKAQLAMSTQDAGPGPALGPGPR